MSHHNNSSKSHATSTLTSEPKASKASAVPVIFHPSDDSIRERAYQISQNRDGGTGTEHSDWTQAERELSIAHSVK